MRQIKFRGVFKVRDNDYYSEDEKNYIESKQHEILSINIGSYCTIAYQDTVMAVFEMHCSNYDILQFTGLVDRNGKEIYEGDICSVDTSRYDSRVKNKRYFRTDVRWYGSGLILFGVTQDLWESDRIEIIGNIHDNPDLLSKIHKDA